VDRKYNPSLLPVLALLVEGKPTCGKKGPGRTEIDEELNSAGSCPMKTTLLANYVIMNRGLCAVGERGVRGYSCEEKRDQRRLEDHFTKVKCERLLVGGHAKDSLLQTRRWMTATGFKAQVPWRNRTSGRGDICGRAHAHSRKALETEKTQEYKGFQLKSETACRVRKSLWP